MKRGRQSAAELSVIPLATDTQRIQPPRYLSADEAAMFRELVGSYPAGSFVPCDVPLLCSYVAATMLADRTAQTLNTDVPNVKDWEVAVKQQVSLATKLRLTRHSRTDPKTLSRKLAAHRPSAYDIAENG